MRHYGGLRGWRRVIAIGLASALWAPIAAAEPAERCRPPAGGDLSALWWSPCPNPEVEARSVRLPLPVAGAEMIFLPIETPGRAIFSRCVSGGRAVIIGDKRDPFALERRRALTGAFRGEEAWRYYLAKYELTVGQAAAILSGDPATGAAGRLADGVAALAAQIDDGTAAAKSALSERVARYRDLAAHLAEIGDGAPSPEHAKHLARPAVGLSVDQIDALARRYSTWCYRSENCRALLSDRAAVGPSLGFVRPPSEIEWEFAARGGARQAAFGLELPFDRSDLRLYANLGGLNPGRAAPEAVIGVGRAPSPGGFYDLFGNVAEVTVDYFSTENGDGKYGGRAARGGSFDTPHTEARSGAREEIGLFHFGPDGALLGPARSVAVGARFSLGALVKTDGAFIREAREAMESEACRVSGEDDPLGERLRGLASRLSDEAGGGEALRELQLEAEETRRALSVRTQNLCRVLAGNMSEFAREQVGFWLRYAEVDPIVADLTDLEASDPQYYKSLRTEYEAQKQRLRLLAEEYFEKYVATSRSMLEHGRSCLADGFAFLRTELEAERAIQREIRGQKGVFTTADAIGIASRHAFEAWLGSLSEDRWRRDFQRRSETLAGLDASPN